MAAKLKNSQRQKPNEFNSHIQKHSGRQVRQVLDTRRSNLSKVSLYLPSTTCLFSKNVWTSPSVPEEDFWAPQLYRSGPNDRGSGRSKSIPANSIHPPTKPYLFSRYYTLTIYVPLSASSIICLYVFLFKLNICN